MRLLHKKVIVTGLIICGGLVFTTAQAQSRSDAASFLLEMQTLRGEIEQLRDMVERQQYDMRRLMNENAQLTQRLNAIAPQSQPAYGNSSYGGMANNTPTTNSTPYGGSNASTLPRSGNNSPTADPRWNNRGAGQNTNSNLPLPNTTAGGGVLSVPGRSATGSSTAQPQQDGYYSRQPGNSSQAGARYQTPSANPTVAGGADGPPIVERDISGASAGNAGSVGSTSPGVTTNPNSAINAGRAPSAPVQSGQKTENAFYDEGFGLLKQSQYEQAAVVFQAQLKNYPRGDLADDALYWIAEAKYISRKPDEAKQHLRQIIDNYPQSSRLPDAMLKTAYIEEQQGNKIEAKILFQEILARYPSSNVAIQAKNRLANLK